MSGGVDLTGRRGPHQGAWTSSGGMDSQGSYVSKILYVKTKESGPLVGGGGGACAIFTDRKRKINVSTSIHPESCS